MFTLWLAAWFDRGSDGTLLQEARASLMQFHGVGRKVADCVALFSLDQHAVIPVDTHVWQVKAAGKGSR